MNKKIITETKGETDLHSTIDAKDWAKEMKRINPMVDEEMAHVWLANSIMCGYDHGYRECLGKATALENALKEIGKQCWIENGVLKCYLDNNFLLALRGTLEKWEAVK